MKLTKISIAISICVAVIGFFYSFYHKGKIQNSITPKQEEYVNKPANQKAAASVKQSIQPDNTTEKNVAAVQKIKQLAAVSPPQPEPTEQPTAKHCPECIERILKFLSDPANSEADKVAACKDWFKPETKDETLSLLRLLKEAHDAQQNDLKDRLLQILAGAESGESAELLLAVINGEMPELDFQKFPEDLQYAVKKAIRLNPDGEKTGQMLAENYSNQTQISPKTAAAIQDIKHPDMIYQLALEADQHGEPEKVGELVKSLQTFADPRTMDVIMRLGKENILTEEDAINAAYTWTNSHRTSFAQDKYEGYLSEPAAAPMERIIAATALAAASNPEQALGALKKASDAEADQNVRYYYEAAIDRIGKRIDNSSSTGD